MKNSPDVSIYGVICWIFRFAACFELYCVILRTLWHRWFLSVGWHNLV